MVEATLILGGLGLLFGIFLGVAARKFAIDKDPKMEEILAALPGANCGACGFPGCSGLAAAIAKGEAAPNACKAGGASVAELVAQIMGVDASNNDRQVVRLICRGGREQARQRAEYVGLNDCRSAKAFGFAGKACTFGCLGLGNCARACPFSAITMGPDGLPVIDPYVCTGCGVCVQTCPQSVLALVPARNRVFVACSSAAPGRQVRPVCQVGCIACRICEKTCEHDAIKVENNLAQIDYSKCTNCGRCADKCPQKIIINETLSEQSAQAVV